MNENIPDRLIRLPEIKARTGMCHTKIYALIKDGGFPRPIKVGRMSVWSSNAVDRWIAARIAEAA